MSEIASSPRRLAHIRMGSNIGQPLTRREGVLKVTGAARYAADNHPAGMLHAVMAVSSIARGRVTSLDVAAAKAHPGVVEVMTPGQHAQARAGPGREDATRSCSELDVLQNDSRALRQPADRGRDRRDAGGGDRGRGAAGPPIRDGACRDRPGFGDSFVPPVVGPGHSGRGQPRRHRGGIAAARRASRRSTKRRRNTTTRWSRTPSWRPGTATRCPSTRRARAWRWRRAASPGYSAFRPENIHIRSPFLGGGFGSKGLVKGPQILGIMAASLVGRPVKLVLRREQMFGPVGHRAPDPADAAHGHRRATAR